VDWRWVGGGSEETRLHTHHHPSPARRHIINQRFTTTHCKYTHHTTQCQPTLNMYILCIK
jgi:hypothetical protein